MKYSKYYSSAVHILGMKKKFWLVVLSTLYMTLLFKTIYLSLICNGSRDDYVYVCMCYVCQAGVLFYDNKWPLDAMPVIRQLV